MSLAEPAPDRAASADARSLPRLIAFRLAFAYWMLFLVPYIVRFLNDPLPLGRIVAGVDFTRRIFVPRAGALLLRLPAESITLHPTGSGDTLFDWVQAFTGLVGAIIAALIWSLIDRRSACYPRLSAWLRVAIRYGLGMALVSYGLAKIFLLQFSTPQLERYLQPYGTSSPMGLLWTMMQSSREYTFFTGLVEATAGLLLFWRRTTIPGALLAATAMTNVVMLNFAYDVPVKLYSAHLLAMSLWLLVPDLPRLAHALLRDESGAAGRHRVLVAVKYVFIALVIGATGYEAWKLQRTRDSAPRPLLYGVYDVDKFEVDGREVPPLLTERTRWRRVVFNRAGGATIYLMGDSFARYGTRLDVSHNTVTLLGGSDPAHPTQTPLTYERNAEWLTLRGPFDGQSITAVLLDGGGENRFLLVNRGFHWVQEYPFNR